MEIQIGALYTHIQTGNNHKVLMLTNITGGITQVVYIDKLLSIWSRPLIEFTEKFVEVQ